jgi:hypothetical protein
MDSVTICNLALLKLGNQNIISFSDGTAPSRFCATLYPPTVNELLRATDWSFAKAIVQLNQITNTPAFDWNYAYQLPNDFLRILGLNNFAEDETNKPYEIMGNQLLTDESTAYISYVKAVTDPNLFDSLFVELLAIRLAQKLAQPLGRSNQLEQILAGEFKQTLEEARRINATGSDQREKPLWVNSSLVQSRVSSIGVYTGY